jgi:Tfp pilus assembly protein PilF
MQESGRTHHHLGIIHLTLSELHTCQNYYQRLFYSILEQSDLACVTSIRSWASTFNYQAMLFLKKEWLNDTEDWEGQDIVDTVALTEAKEYTRQIFSTLEGIISLGLVPHDQFSQKMAITLNFLYLHARRLHLTIKELTNFNIELPRVTLMDTFQTDEGIPAFRVAPEHIFDLEEDAHAPIRSLQGQRSKKYDELIQKGHAWIAKKEYDLGRESFFKALNYKETAEAYNLIGWTYSLEKQFETAKNFCLKAIKIDPAYGASYNDLGSYLLSEGQVQESLKWFELAKNSRNYQNREYPYINSGRAFMNLRNFKAALEEFSMALTLVPQNEELHQTVQRLKETLNKGNLFAMDKNREVPPPLF